MYYLSPSFLLTLPSFLFSGTANTKPTAAGLSVSSTRASTNCTYASRSHISSLFNSLTNGDATTFYASVVDDVDWNVQGTHPLAGRYNNKTIFLINAVNRIAKIQDYSKPHVMEVQNIVGGCDEEWSAQEIHVTAYMNNGAFFDNTYAWMTRWNSEGQIVQVRAYLDSALVAKSVFENEMPTNSTFTTLRDTIEPGPGGYGPLP